VQVPLAQGAQGQDQGIHAATKAMAMAKITTTT